MHRNTHNAARTGHGSWSSCRQAGFLAVLGIFGVLGCSISPAQELNQRRWSTRLDIGVAIPADTTVAAVSEGQPVGTFDLHTGLQFDVAVEYQLTPWLGIGPEIGFTMNFLDSSGSGSYLDGYLIQFPLMANVVFRYPTEGVVMPMAGVGAGGVASFLSSGAYNYSGSIYGWDSWSSDTDFVPGFQVFGGIGFRMGDSSHIGVFYRYLQTDSHHWDVEGYRGQGISFSADSVEMHSICLFFTTSW